jgi:hypothetical protein
MPTACAECTLTASGAQVRQLGGANGGGSPVDARSPTMGYTNYKVQRQYRYTKT